MKPHAGETLWGYRLGIDLRMKSWARGASSQDLCRIHQTRFRSVGWGCVLLAAMADNFNTEQVDHATRSPWNLTLQKIS
jgi:hypothetical protein